MSKASGADKHDSIAPLSRRSRSSTLLRELPLQDVAQYTEPNIPTVARVVSTTTLAELAHLVHLQAYHLRKRWRLRQRLNRCLVSSALSARLTRCGEQAQMLLAHFLRAEDKKSFVALHGAIEHMRVACDATRRYAFLEPDLESGTSDLVPTEGIPSTPTFLHQLPLNMRDDFLHFLSELRTNPDFLAARITSLSALELSSISPFYQSFDPSDSVIPSHGRAKLHGFNGRRGAASSLSSVDSVYSFQRHDPLAALMHTIFAGSGGPNATEDLRRTEIWSTTCARIIAEGTPGGEQFTRTVLNAWAAMREWPVKASLELFLMDALQEGDWLLDALDDHLPGPGPTSETRAMRDALAADKFFNDAVERLLGLINHQPNGGGIPQGVLEIGQAIIHKLDNPKKQRAAQTFIVSKWFFSGFLMHAIINPEVSGC